MGESECYKSSSFLLRVGWIGKKCQQSKTKHLDVNIFWLLIFNTKCICYDSLKTCYRKIRVVSFYQDYLVVKKLELF